MINNINSNYYTSLYGVNSLYGNNSTNPYSKLYDALNSYAGSSLNNRNTVGTVDYTSMNSITELRSGAKDVRDVLSSMQSGAAFKKTTAVSSNSEALSINSSSTVNAKLADKSVDIEKIATGQANEGQAMKASNRAAAGDYKIQIETGGKSYTVSFKVNAGETNQQMQQKMADAINNQNIGVTASVSKDGNNSTLTVQSKNTGDSANSRFSIRDVAGNAVSKTGTGAATQDAQDAVYSVDGEKFTSKSNVVSLGDGVSATLEKATTESVKVGIGASEEAAVSSAKKLVENFNSLLTNAAGGSRLSRELSSVSRSYASSLSKIGIDVAKDGSLSVNQDKLNAAAKDGKLQDFFKQDMGKTYGFSNNLSRVAGNVERSPLNYTSVQTNSGSSFSNSNIYNNVLASNQMNMMGMFFNLMI